MALELTKIGALLAKIESTYGTDPNPDGTNNPVPCVRAAVKLTPMNDKAERMLLDGGHSRLIGDTSLPRMKIAFTLELLGNATIQNGATVHAYLSPLLKSCDMSETATAESSGGAADGYITYKPAVTSDNGSSMAFYFHSQLKKHILTGCKGTVKFRLEAGKYAYADFEFTGIYNAIADSSFPSLVFSYTNKPPLFVSASTLTWGSYTPIVQAVEFDLGNAIGMRPDPTQATGIKGFVITDRSITGSFDPEAVAEATQPWWADWRTPTLRTLTAVLGATAGNRFTFTTTCQLTDVTPGDRNGVATHACKFDVVKTSIATANGSEFQLKMH